MSLKVELRTLMCLLSANAMTVGAAYFWFVDEMKAGSRSTLAMSHLAAISFLLLPDRRAASENTTRYFARVDRPYDVGTFNSATASTVSLL